MNNKGQEFMIGILILVMAMILFIGTLPALKLMFNNARGCSYLNCNGYIDPDASGASCTSSNQSYDIALEEDDLACTIMDLGIPYLILGVLIAAISLLIHNKLVQRPAEPSYQGYGY